MVLLSLGKVNGVGSWKEKVTVGFRSGIIRNQFLELLYFGVHLPRSVYCGACIAYVCCLSMGLSAALFGFALLATSLNWALSFWTKFMLQGIVA